MKRTSHASRSRSSGVTLIELLLALFIGTVAAIAVFALFLGQSRGMRQSQESMEIHDNVRVAMDVMARDLRSAGFMAQDGGSIGYALRVENNCGKSPNTGVDADGVQFTGGIPVVPSATDDSISEDGDYSGTLQADGCPNGSDRITTTYRQTTQYIKMTGSNNGNNPKVTFDCDPWGSCGTALNGLGLSGVCMPGGGTSAPVQFCVANDPNRCFLATFVEGSGGACPCNAVDGLVCDLDVADYATGNPFQSQHNWTPALCPDPAAGCSNQEAKQNMGVGAWVTRSYQLLDADANGSTELVSSLDQASFTSNPSTVNAPVNATFDVVANYIDDLQVAVAYRSAPDTFLSHNLWNLPSCTPTNPAPSTAGDDLCLFAMTSTPGSNNPPVAVRVTVVARSAKRRFAEVGTGGVDPFFRPNVEDNNAVAVQDNYTPGTIPGGPAQCYPNYANCGCGGTALPNYMTCSMRGNAEGYARRVVSQVIALRNLADIP